MNPRLFTTICIVTAELFTGAMAHAGHCRQFFVQHHKVQAVVAVPQVYYFAGQATQDEALIRKAIRAEAPAILREALQQLQAPQQQTAGVISQKCGRCHTGEAAKGGVRLDGVITDDVFRRSMEMIGEGVNVPKEMQPVISGLKDGEHAAIMSEMLKRPATAEPGILR